MALLREFTEHNSERAFALLVSRHLNKVYSAALRQTRNPHHAEEITQAVFVILARKAPQLRERTNLSGWIYQTTRLTAVTFIRSEMRRARREHEAHMETLSNQPEPAVWQQLAPLLDDAVAKLGTADRDAIVLRFFDGKSMKEVGTELGLNENSAAKRISRAVDKLRSFFAKRGVVLSATAVCAAISANAVQAAPAQFSASVAAAATTSAALAASTNTLANGVMQLMTWLKIKMAVGVVGVALIAGGGLAVATRLDKGDITPADILKRSQQKYSSLSSYSDTWRTVAFVGATQIFDGLIYSNRMMLGRPLLYRIESIAEARPSVSAAIWSAGDGDFWSMSAGQWRQNRPDATNFMPEFHVLFPSAPIPCAFFNKRDWDSLPALAQAKDLVRLADESIGTNDCYTISATTKAPVYNITLWIGKNDFLINQLRFVWVTGNASARRAGTETDAAGNPRRITNTVIKTHENIVVNRTIAATEFMRPLPTNTGPAFLHHTLYDTDGSPMNASMIDLESGKMFSSWALEKPFSGAFVDGLSRMRQEGIDLCGDTSGKTFSGFDMIIVPAEQAFALATSETTASDPRLRGRAEAQVNVTVQDVPATYFFKTREGSRGVLEVIRFSTNLESMDFRYRLLQPARATVENVTTHSSANSGSAIPVRAFDRLYEFEMSSSDKRFLDLDTGGFVAAHPPGDLFWAASESDLQARTGMNMSAVAVTPEKWATASASEVLERLRTEPVQKQVRIGGSASKLEPVSKQTWFFRTSEGGAGVLQILPHNARTDSVMVRWKLALPRTGERTVPANK